MTRTVLDTNTWVSGLGWGGPPGDVVQGVRIVSPADFINELEP